MADVLETPDTEAGSPRVRTVNIGQADAHTWGGTTETTAIVKAAVHGQVKVGSDGLVGDDRADRVHHGGPYHAVYAYAAEDYQWWSAELGRDLPDGYFGDNLTVVGIDLSKSCIGDRWDIGTTTFEVCGPRIPCQTFARRVGEPKWVKRFTKRGHVGAYLRVVTEGSVQEGDAIAVTPVLATDNPTFVTVMEAFRAMTTEQARMPMLAEVAALPAEVRARAVAASVQ